MLVVSQGIDIHQQFNKCYGLHIRSYRHRDLWLLKFKWRSMRCFGIYVGIAWTPNNVSKTGAQLWVVEVLQCKLKRNATKSKRLLYCSSTQLLHVLSAKAVCKGVDIRGSTWWYCIVQYCTYVRVGLMED